MSTTTKKIQHKYNPRATYFQGYKIPKKLMLWVPPSVEADFLDNPDLPSIMEFVYYIEANNVERIDTTIYEDSFQQFYDYHINIKKYNKPKSSFCATTADGGVGTEYIIESADSLYENENTITLLSVDGKNITEVYALVTFRLINHQPDTIMVETLCGNQSLPPSGEGTRLINYLMRLAQDIGINNVALHPIDSAIGYYTRLNFIELREDEADAINDEEGITTFKINTRARKNWKKAMNSIRFAIHQKKLKEMEQAKIITRTTFPKKQGIPINPPFSKETQKFIPKPTGKIHDVERNENGDIIVSRVAYKIEPGKSLRLAKMKDEMKNAYKMADIIKQNVIIKKKKELPVPVPVKEEQKESSPKLSEKEIERQAREFLKEEENAALKIFEQRKKNEEKKEAKKKRNTKTANLRKTIGRIMANGTRKRKPKRRA